MDDEEFSKRISLIAYKELNEVTDEDVRLLEIEKNRCRSFPYFLKYVKLIEPPGFNSPGGVIPLELWPHIKKTIKTFLESRLVVILKSRQIGASWLIATYVLWYAMFNKGANILLFSKGEREAIELLGKAYRVLGQLPPFLKLKPKPDSSEELGFPEMMSSIKAFGSTESAGISFTASMIVCDEWEEHPYAEQNFFFAKPCIDSGNGRFIGVFTRNKKKLTSLARSTFVSALEGKNGFAPLFFPYTVRPGRDEAWYNSRKSELTPEELEGLTPDLYMEGNYPRSVEEALRSTSSISAFNHRVLDNMMEDVRNPIEVVGEGIDPKIIHIYKDFHIGNFYIAGTDTSHGVGRDYGVTCVMNVKTGEIVADIMSNILKAEELAWHSIKLLELFKKPLWFIENNDWGGITIATAQSMRYSNLGYEDANRKRVGFNTKGYSTPSGIKGTRTDLYGALIPAVNNRQITIYNKDGLKQFFELIRNVEKEGRIEAMSGGHDDYPIAVGICWVKKGDVHTEWNVQPIQTLTFSRR